MRVSRHSLGRNLASSQAVKGLCQRQVQTQQRLCLTMRQVQHSCAALGTRHHQPSGGALYALVNAS